MSRDVNCHAIAAYFRVRNDEQFYEKFLIKSVLFLYLICSKKNLIFSRC